jgi:translation initiation factor 1
MSKQGHPTVWSSEHGDLRKKDSQPVDVKSLPPRQQTVYLHRETKGRGGRPVSLVKNLVLSEADLKALSRQLKEACGSGGTVKGGLIEIQGEHREKISKSCRLWDTRSRSLMASFVTPNFYCYAPHWV